MSENIIITLINKVFDFLSILLGRGKSKKEKELLEIQSSEKDLLVNHYLFNRIQELITHIDLKFALPNKAKELVIKDILKNIMLVYQKALYNLADEIDKNPEITDEELSKLHLKVFTESIYDYTNFYFNGYYTNEEKQVFSIIMPKFNKWHYPRIQFMQESIDRISKCIFYKDAKTKSSVIFDVYTGTFSDTILDAELTLNELNGELKGLSYKGYKF